jgi:hypothetical protein
MKTDIGLHILKVYRSKNPIKLEQEIFKLPYSELESLIDNFNAIGKIELAQMLFDRKKNL